MALWLTEVGKSGEFLSRYKFGQKIYCGNTRFTKICKRDEEHISPHTYFKKPMVELARAVKPIFLQSVFKSQEYRNIFAMFIGEYQHTIDPKKRLALPSKFRGELGTKVVITRGLDNCLFVYPIKVWEELATKLGTLPVGEAGTRSFIRVMLAGATDVELDSQGRILVPEYLKKDGGLKKEVTVVGLFNRLEIWDTAKWNKYKLTAEKNTGKIAEDLGKLGIY